ncbi:SH3 domain-containing protein PJ696.02 [Hondaea fermentalgiana]|uniref:SH3 domain-containing protein PJ696.02 n=1 Tax=Hondaea fermentalgiana TaxID=2315210 RepID=A0A2R5GSE5_9STRA|nr:SH3 domain-containing protein PJ696.02 [Hondaea fermentalgiana]|eukprot:GBG33515.1 SH3 domain-containing protein PJ696.02 [Hondaea fermentalgiana]
MLFQADHVVSEVEHAVQEAAARAAREGDPNQDQDQSRNGDDSKEQHDARQRQEREQQRRLRQLEFGQWRRGLLVSLARSAAPRASARERNSSRFKKRVQNARWRLWSIDKREAERSGRSQAPLSSAWGAGAPRLAANPLEADSCSSNPNLMIWTRARPLRQLLHRGRGEDDGDESAHGHDPDGDTDDHGDHEHDLEEDFGDDDHHHLKGERAAAAAAFLIDRRSMTPSPAPGTAGGLMFELDETAGAEDLGVRSTADQKASAQTPMLGANSDSEEDLSSSASDSSLSAGETASLAAAIPQRVPIARTPRAIVLNTQNSSSSMGSATSMSSYEFPRRPAPWRALRPLRETAAGPDKRWLAPTSLLVGDAAHQRAVRKLLEASPYVLKAHFRARLAAGRGSARWHKRFYVLTENFLFEYESRKDPVPLACVALAELVTSVTTAGSLLISFERPAKPALPEHDRTPASMFTRSPESMAAGIERLRWQERRFEGGSLDDPGKGDPQELERRLREKRLEGPDNSAGEGGVDETNEASSTLPPPPVLQASVATPPVPPLQASHSGGDLAAAEQSVVRGADCVVVELQPLAGQDVQAWRSQIQFNASLRIADLYAINVDERLGVGRYAEVHECTRATDGRRSAVKVVNKSDYFELVAMGKERPSALGREISTQAYLADRMVATGRDLGCAPILRVFETQSLLVIETELMDRRNLHELLRTSKDRRFSEPRAADVAIALLRILQQLQYYRVAHRDIKLSNVTLLRGRGDRFRYLSPFELRSGLRLIDFGMATYIDRQGTLTGRCGTPGYVAPEILACKSGGRYPANVDIFSVGVLVCTLLCGREPFQRGTTQATMVANRNCELDLANEDMSRDAVDFLTKVLTRDPARRLAPAQALAHPWLASQPRPPPRVARATPFSKTADSGIKPHVQDQHQDKSWMYQKNSPRDHNDDNGNDNEVEEHEDEDEAGAKDRAGNLEERCERAETMSTKGKTSERLSMKGQIHKAYKVMLKLVNPKFVKSDQSIPLRVLQNAKGIAFVTQIKAGFVWTGSAGSGIVIARLPDGSWSGPSSLGTVGMGWGAQIGGSVTDSVIILNTTMAVKAFSGKGQVKFGGNISVAAGPVGREGDAAVNAGDGGIAACYSYSHSRGAFAGLSMQGSILVTRSSDNKKFYGRKVSATAILSGAETPPENEDLRLLYNTLRVVTHSKTPDFEYRDSRTGSLQQEFSTAGLDDDLPPSQGGYYEDSSATLGPSMAESNASLGAYPTATYASSYDDNNGATAAKTESYSYATPYSPPPPPPSSSSSSGLPPGWQEVKTDQGEVYYWNQTLNKTQWERPEPETPAPAPAASPAAAPPTMASASAGHEQQQQQQQSSWGSQQSSWNSSPAQSQQQPQQQPKPLSSSTWGGQQSPTPAAASTSPAGHPNLASELSSRLSLRQEGSSANAPSSSQATGPPGVASRPAPTRRPPSARPAAPQLGSAQSTRDWSTTASSVAGLAKQTSASERPLPATPAQSTQSSAAAPSPSYTLEQVMGREVPDMDPRRLDEYLRDEDFQRAFGMGRAEFNAMPKWKRDNLKKAKSLF